MNYVMHWLQQVLLPHPEPQYPPVNIRQASHDLANEVQKLHGRIEELKSKPDPIGEMVKSIKGE